MTRLVPSEAQQKRVRARLADPTLMPRLRAELTAAGFAPDAFAPFERTFIELRRPALIPEYS